MCVVVINGPETDLHRCVVEMCVTHNRCVVELNGHLMMRNGH